MKTIWSIVIVLVALVLLYLAYKYFIAKPKVIADEITTNNNSSTNSSSNGQGAATSAFCSSLSVWKDKVDSSYSLANDAFVKYSAAVAAGVPAITLKSLSDNFKSKEDIYKRNVSAYNFQKKASATKCPDFLIIEEAPFVYNGTPYISIGEPTPAVVCDLSKQKLDIQAQELQVISAYAFYQMANLNVKYSEYEKYKNTYNIYSIMIDAYNTLSAKCFADNGIQVPFLTKIKFYDN